MLTYRLSLILHLIASQIFKVVWSLELSVLVLFLPSLASSQNYNLADPVTLTHSSQDITVEGVSARGLHLM